MDIQQNTLYLLTRGSYVARDHLTLVAEVPVYPPDLPEEERSREKATDWRKLSIPIHHLESVCVFGASTVSPPALGLCWEHGVAVNYLSERGCKRSWRGWAGKSAGWRNWKSLPAKPSWTKCAGRKGWERNSISPGSACC